MYRPHAAFHIARSSGVERENTGLQLRLHRRMIQPRWARRNEQARLIDEAGQTDINPVKLVAWTAGETSRFRGGVRNISISLLGRTIRDRIATHGLRIIGIVMLAFCTLLPEAQTQQQPKSESQKIPLLIGRPAPSFAIKSLDGKAAFLSDYKGRAVIVNFWATWCGICKVEMPWLEQLREKYASQGFEVLGVVTDDAPVTKISALTQKYGVHYPIVTCNHATAQAYGGLPDLPESFFIDRHGTVVAVMDGSDSEKEIEVNIRKALGRQ